MSALAVTALTLAALAAHAQVFESASVKPTKVAGGYYEYHFRVLPNRLNAHNVTLWQLIKQANDLRDDQVSGPDWLDRNHYDLIATTGEAVSKDTMRTMLRNLLIERFHLESHWDTRTGAMYRLVTLPKGIKMNPAVAAQSEPNSPTSDGNSIRFEGAMSMQQLAERLTPFARRPVVDATKLEGAFNLKLRFDSEDPSRLADDGVTAPTLAAALQEQLGLKLVPAKDAIKILVVDRADAVPVAN